MKVALIGVTGAVGLRVATELLTRGHSATGIVRHLEKSSPRTGLSVIVAIYPAGIAEGS